ncbi:MAG: shikimate dehydrogenase [Desulfosarcinaceae bacterium]|nr:shikimate dehydrogenase [Desulfosarcinaceae bacterium]
MRAYSIHTKLVILLGNPLGHTRSPAMHNRLFEKMDLDYLYLPVEVSNEDLPTVFAGLRKMNVTGFNVTIPHKIAIMDLLDALDPLAEVIGAVNTICIEDGRSIGYNTDGEGFIQFLEATLDTNITGKRLFILGCGGAGRGISMTMASRGAARMFLCNRTASKAETLAAEINAKIRPCAETIPHSRSEMRKALTACDIFVNATSLGMHPHHEEMPIEADLLHPYMAVADLVYNPLMTRLLTTSRRLGCPIVKGHGMLVHQGALGFRLWTGVDPIIDEMFQALNLPVN